MQSNNNKVWAFLGLVIVVVLIVVGIKSSKNGKMSNETGPIKIGFIAPLSGDAAAYGEPIRNAVELVTNQINAKGGINGRPVQVIYEDGKCNGTTASLAAQKLITVDKVVAMLGGACSSELMAVAPIAEENKVVVISPGATAPAISNAGDYIFRVIPSDSASAKKMVELIAKKGYKKVGIISEQTEYGQGLKVAFEQYSKEAGIELVYNESYSTDTVDFKPFGLKVNQSGAEALFINAQTGATGSKIAKAIRDQGGKSQYFTYFLSGDDFVKSGSSVNGTIVLDVDAAVNTALNDVFMADYKTVYKSAPGYAAFAITGHDAINILFNAIAKVGTDSTKIKNYLYKMPAYNGIMGNLTFDSNGDPLGNDIFISKQIKDGKLVELK
jgi:branched-chain amino acid transport system substrate-binding protein